MKKTVVLYVAASLDGYIARKDGRIDWLTPFENEDYGYDDFYKTVGTVIMGNNTYRQILSFGKYPYPAVDSFVFTRKNNKSKDENVTFISMDARDFMDSLKPGNNKKIWLVGGAALIEEFLSYNLIDEYIITLIPILLGSGVPLFKGNFNEEALRLKDVKVFNSGLVQIYYERMIQDHS